MEKETNGHKKLRQYDVLEVIDLFNIEQTQDSQVLGQWLSAVPHLVKEEIQLLDKKRKELMANEKNWNEQELIVRFVAHIIELAQLEVPKKIGLYFERIMSGTVENIDISVIPDCSLATPKQSGKPKEPYFFLQEYKRTKGDRNDPEGQMLAAMILAQTINKNDKPLFGAWLQGKFWHFAVLEGKNYALSEAFDATQKEDLYKILAILRALKNLILEI